MPPTWAVVQVHDGTGALSIQLLRFNKNTKISPALLICAFLKVFISLQHDIPCAWSDFSLNLNYRVRPSLVNRFSSFLRLRAETGQFPNAVSWPGWLSMMHCDDLEGEQRSLAHKSRPLRLLGVSAWPVNLMIEKQALGQTARPLTVAL